MADGDGEECAPAALDRYGFRYMKRFFGRRLAVLGLWVVPPMPVGLAAQEPAPTRVDTAMIAAAASTITGPEVQRALAILASDSLRHRPVGSPTLTRAAAYVRQAFVQLGLSPNGAADASSDSAWLQRYSLSDSRIAAYDRTVMAFTMRLRSRGDEVLDEGGATVQGGLEVHFTDLARFGTDTVLAFDPGALGGSMVLVAGRQTPLTVRAAKLRDELVLYVPAADADSATRQAVLATLNATNHVVVLSDEDSVTFATRLNAEQRKPPVVVSPDLAYRTGFRYWRSMVWAPALHALLVPAGVDLGRARMDTLPVTQRLLSLHVRMYMGSDAPPPKAPYGFNVVGVLPGIDSSLGTDGLAPVWVEALVVSASLDSADSLDNALGNASGVAGLLAVAKALSQPGARPRRSIVFVATTGAQDNVGVRAFLRTYLRQSSAVLWNVTLEDLAGPPQESVNVAGLQDYVFARPPQWEALRRTGLSLVDGGSSLTASSDRVAFIEARIPSWRVSASAAMDATGDRTSSAADATTADLVAQRARFVYYVVQAIANAPGWPQWTLRAAQARRLFLNGH